MTSGDDIPQTRYARADGLRIAYQRFGVVGGVRVVIIPGLVSNIDLAWDHETYRRMFDHMRHHLDCVHFDKRGMGLSDRFDDAPTIAERSNDIVAVMDALEWESACIVGVSEGGAMVETWGEDARPMLEQFAPSQVDNDSFVRWTNRFNRLAVSPGSLLNQLLSISSITGAIPDVEQSIPTLIVHGEGDRILPIGNGRALAEQMPHATYVELPGEDHTCSWHRRIGGSSSIR
jgi:pimeloyl-ACP methyl ester carboxylesterase